MIEDMNAHGDPATVSDDGEGGAAPGIPQGKVMLLNGYDIGYPGDGLIALIDEFAGPVLRDRIADAAPKFGVDGEMMFTAGTWRVEVPGALGNMIFPRQRPLRAVNLDPAARYRVGGAVDNSATPPVMDIQLIENLPSTGRKWIFEDLVTRR